METSVRIEAILRAVNVKKYFVHRAGVLHRSFVKAVDRVSFEIHNGDTFGLVGESGCGKTTLGRVCLGLLPSSGGELILQGKNLSSLSKRSLRRARRNVQLVFQDPEGSLNPRMTVASLVSEPLEVGSGRISGRIASDVRRQTVRALEQVGLGAIHLHRYPHELSGGQKQRVGIARALITCPELVVLDEPTASLDLLVQAQVLNILREAHKELGLAYIFISHDLGVIKYMCRRIAVMYLGRFVELGPAKAIMTAPAHPYTRALLSSVLSPNAQQKKATRIVLKGEVPSPLNPPSGCRFHPRCESALSECAAIEPELMQISEGHYVACTRLKNELHKLKQLPQEQLEREKAEQVLVSEFDSTTSHIYQIKPEGNDRSLKDLGEK